MGRELVTIERDRLVLRRREGRLTWFFLVGAFLWAALGALEWFAVGPVPGLQFGGFTLLFALEAVWNHGRRDEVRFDGDRISISKWVGPLRLAHHTVHGRPRLVDHAAGNDAMFDVVAMTGPGYLEIQRSDGPPVPLARGLRYDEPTLRAVLKQLEERLR